MSLAQFQAGNNKRLSKSMTGKYGCGFADHTGGTLQDQPALGAVGIKAPVDQAAVFPPYDISDHCHYLAMPGLGVVLKAWRKASSSGWRPTKRLRPVPRPPGTVADPRGTGEFEHRHRPGSP